MIRSDILGFFFFFFLNDHYSPCHTYIAFYWPESSPGRRTYKACPVCHSCHTQACTNRRSEKNLFTCSLRSQLRWAHPAGSLRFPVLCFVFTRIIHILFTYYRAFIVEAVCNEIVATDDGCFFLRHNIKLTKMIPLVPTDGGESIH